MKGLFFIGLFSIYCIDASTQSVAISTNGSAPNASAMLDIKSNTKGLLIPRTSTVSRNAIVNPAKGLIIYDTTAASFWFHNGSAWTQLAAAGNGWSLSGNAVADPSASFIGTNNSQPLRFRVNNIWAGEIHPTSSNVMFGLNAGNVTTTGLFNTGVGDHSLFLNTIGSYNTASGSSTLYSNTEGSVNTAFGTYALAFNRTGSRNTAAGADALNRNTTGTENTGIGYRALAINEATSQNTAIGSQSLSSNTTGSFNTASGAMALFSNTTGSYNVAAGIHSLQLNTTGGGNTANGANALVNNTSGNNNTATGALALFSNTTGSANAANGVQALTSNTTGYNNVASGVDALYSNNSGFYNTAMGYRSLYFNTAGYENTAFGGQALYSNVNGSFNSAFGINALYTNTSGINNTAFGEKALYSNNTGQGNTAVGLTSLYFNTGNFNVATGASALVNNSTGSYNTAVGLNAFSENLTGTGVTALGASTALNGWTNLVNATAIGYAAIVDDHNKVRIGNNGVLSIGGHVGWTTFSDGRFKQQVEENVKGLEFIMALRPVTYIIDLPGLNKYQHPGKKDTDDSLNIILRQSKYQGLQRAATHRESGFIAQEVELAASRAGFTFSGVDKPTSDHALYGLRYGDFVVPLVKAVQEQQSVIEKLQKQIDTDKAGIPAQMQAQQIMIDELKNEIATLKSEMDLMKKKN
ncbi:MAG: tail fiber domain-containing protein [Ferruginibacter sp.]